MYLPIRLQHSASHAWRTLCESAQTAAGISGIFLTRVSPFRAVVSLTALLFAMWSLGRDQEVSPGSALLAFAVAAAARHAFAFSSFIPNGIAPRLRSRLGPELGFSVYESATALLLLAQRLSFIRLLVATSDAPSGTLGAALISFGAAIVALGVGVHVWATRIIGLETYYYRDLFAGPRHANLELRGPYAVLANPIYGVGQLAAYGCALALPSPIGLAAAALNQIGLYAFNALIEQPHLNAASRIATEWSLRDELSHTLLELPPRRSRGNVRPPEMNPPQ